jgi:hypothetical protein
MQLMRGCRSIVCGLLSCAVAGVLLLPQEHVHVEDVADGHHTSVVHRHFAPHQVPDPRTSLDHPDNDPQWLLSVLAGPQGPVRLSPERQIGQSTPIHVTATLRVVAVASITTEASIHDPPLIGSLGLRAPPASLL